MPHVLINQWKLFKKCTKMRKTHAKVKSGKKALRTFFCIDFQVIIEIRWQWQPSFPTFIYVLPCFIINNYSFPHFIKETIWSFFRQISFFLERKKNRSLIDLSLTRYFDITDKLGRYEYYFFQKMRLLFTTLLLQGT